MCWVSTMFEASLDYISIELLFWDCWHCTCVECQYCLGPDAIGAFSCCNTRVCVEFLFDATVGPNVTFQHAIWLMQCCVHAMCGQACFVVMLVLLCLCNMFVLWCSNVATVHLLLCVDVEVVVCAVLCLDTTHYVSCVFRAVFLLCILCLNWCWCDECICWTAVCTTWSHWHVVAVSCVFGLLRFMLLMPWWNLKLIHWCIWRVSSLCLFVDAASCLVDNSSVAGPSHMFRSMPSLLHQHGGETAAAKGTFKAWCFWIDPLFDFPWIFVLHCACCSL